MIGLYIHIPYCKRKCDYCSFYSLPSNIAPDNYIDAVVKEIKSYKITEKERVDSVYIGGGTPSLLAGNQLQTLFEAIRDTFILVDPEISIESNPESINEDFLNSCKSLGVNRISLGIQSLDDFSLASIGRLHDRKKAIEGLVLCKKYFDNVNADYMLGLPFQNMESIEKDINLLCDIGVTHLSVYSLILEEGTPLYDKYNEGKVILASDDTQVDYYNNTLKILSSRGFERYEISNFSKKGYECRHNLNCWRLEEYIGIGPSAHSFYKGKRFFNSSDLDGYILNKGIVRKIEEGDNTPYDREAEYIMLGLRTVKGISLDGYKAQFKYNFKDRFHQALLSLGNYVEFKEKHIKIRDEYFYISNTIIEEFISCIDG